MQKIHLQVPHTEMRNKVACKALVFQGCIKKYDFYRLYEHYNLSILNQSAFFTCYPLYVNFHYSQPTLLNNAGPKVGNSGPTYLEDNRLVRMHYANV